MKPYFVIAAALIVLPFAASAQSGWSPSSDDLVNMLKPKASGPTRGIRALGALPAEPAATPVAAHAAPAPAVRDHAARPQAAAEPAADLASVPLHVEFPSGSDKLTPGAMKTLDELGKALSNPALASYRFRIEGHTDAVGTPETNEALSARRAAAVASYIESRYGIDQARITTAGMGYSQMLVPTAVGVAEPRNRRVQIVNVGS